MKKRIDFEFLFLALSVITIAIYFGLVIAYIITDSSTLIIPMTKCLIFGVLSYLIGIILGRIEHE